MKKGPLVLCANGFADNQRVEGTPGLAEHLHELGIRRILHIGWAANNLPLEATIQIPTAIQRMLNAGFEVGDLPYRAIYNELSEGEKYDALYINGGNPSVLSSRARYFGLSRAVRHAHRRGIPIIAASAAAMWLGTGTLVLGAWAPQPTKPLPIRDRRGLRTGLGLHPYVVIPHKSDSPVLRALGVLLTPLLWNPRILPIPDGQFVPL